jgi:hypothetical protein
VGNAAERHYGLAFPDEQSARAALAEGLQREPYMGQLHEPSRPGEAWLAYFVTFDADPPASKAAASEEYFRALAMQHAGHFLGLD